jgi:hypothetical protein
MITVKVEKAWIFIKSELSIHAKCHENIKELSPGKVFLFNEFDESQMLYSNERMSENKNEWKIKIEVPFEKTKAEEQKEEKESDSETQLLFSAIMDNPGFE